MNYTVTSLRAYLTKHYTPVYRRSDCDFFYNFRNRRKMSLPLKKVFFSELEVKIIFENAELIPEKEFVRFTEFINKSK